MPLETATYVTDLVTSNPAHSDGLNNGDAHLRLLKSTIKATFPNFTSAALNSTQAQLDGVVTTVNTTGVSVLADAGVNFKTNNTDGITNPSAGTIGVKVAGTVLATFVNSTSTLTVNGTVAATHTGPGSIPIGTPLMWLTDTLPSGVGTWAWANGQAISRATYATLFAAIGTTYGVGDGSTTFNLPNWQEVTLVGKSTMGGASSPGLLASVGSGIKTLLGKLFGADTHTLTAAEIPTITSDNTGAVSLTVTGTPSAPNAGGSSPSGGGSVSGTGTASAMTSTGTIAAHAITSSSTNTGGAAHQILQPSMTVNFIIRIA